MQVKGKAYAVKYFTALLLLFGVMIVYLLFFNSGLEIVEDIDESGSPVFYLENQSAHVIRDATVSMGRDGEWEVLLGVERLRPGERRRVYFDVEGEKRVVLAASAPFHVIAEKTIVLGEASKPSLSPTISGPSIVAIGEEFELSVEVCNEGSSAEEVIVEESHNREFFSRENESQRGRVEGSSCAGFSYSFSAGKTGPTTVFFKVKAVNYVDSRSWNLEVV